MKSLLACWIVLLLVVIQLTRAAKSLNFDEDSNEDFPTNIQILARLEDLERNVSEQKTRLAYQGEENLNLNRKLRNHVAESVNNKKEDPSALDVATQYDAKVAAIFPRSCQEIFNMNPSAPKEDQIMPTPDGQFQFIDPDGPGVGDPPIMVQCINGKTLVSHDSEGNITARNCLNEGCYKKNVTYSGGATIRQMSALIALSTECQQSFTYFCTFAFFEYPTSDKGLRQYSWWLDRYGQRQYFWAGKFISGGNENERHVCQCGISKNCEDTNYSCNCDIVRSFPVPSSDTGLITEKGLLPVTQVSLGKIEGSGVFNLGKLECSGSFGTLIEEPTGCRDLYQLGHTNNGFYTVRGIGTNSNNIETVFCNFRVPAINDGFETRLGILCTNCQTRVYFYAQGFSGTNPLQGQGNIGFLKEILNEGKALNVETGVFTAPVDGIYYFTLSGFQCANVQTIITLKLNFLTNVALASYVFMPTPTSPAKYAVEATLSLKQGDTVNPWFSGCITETGEVPIHLVTNFNGWLLEEK